jgi:membrane protein YqaA with SNARE-associated domain
MLWFAMLIIFYLIIKQYVAPSEQLVESLYDKPTLVYGVFLISEVVFGIIPPEVFMIWSLHGGATEFYALNVLLLSLISYGAGVSGYFIGVSFSSLEFFKTYEAKYLHQYKRNLRRYGGYLVVAAAMTPLPFSAVAMAVAVFQYPFKYYLFYSFTRFLRFSIYGYIIWQANVL